MRALSRMTSRHQDNNCADQLQNRDACMGVVLTESIFSRQWSSEPKKCSSLDTWRGPTHSVSISAPAEAIAMHCQHDGKLQSHVKDEPTLVSLQ